MDALLIQWMHCGSIKDPSDNWIFIFSISLDFDLRSRLHILFQYNLVVLIKRYNFKSVEGNI